jgi:Sushi repeat (SCR repeat)
MFRLIAIFSFVLVVETVNGFARCPFPGTTAGVSIKNKFISWQFRPYLQEGETLRYECKENWRPVKGVRYSLTCQRDGRWTAPLPYCGNYIFNSLAKLNEPVTNN